MISHLKWMGHGATMYEIQRSLRDDPETCEVTLVAKDYSVRAHRFVLSSCSDLLRSLMVDLPLGHEATVIVPGIKGELLDSVLAFIYLGETQISSANLSDFLEAINLLGIKSAISFECNTVRQVNALPVKAVTNLHVVQEGAIEQENAAMQKIETPNVIDSQELIDVYNETHPKIHYSIEQMAAATQGCELILTENAGEFTLTPNTKIDAATDSDSAKFAELEVEEEEEEDGEVEGEEDADDDSIIEEYSAADNIIEMATENTTNTTESSATETAATSQFIEIKQNIRTVKMKSVSKQQQQTEENNETPSIFDSNEIVDDRETHFTIIHQTAEDVGASSTLVKSSSINDPLELAVQGVLKEGMSLQKAAQKYEISKTVLWRRVRKDPNYNKTARENPVLNLACERLKHGESMKNISRELDIPMSTLHRHKVRLSQQGRLPKWVTFKKRDANSKDELREKLNKAVHACIHDGMSQNHAASLFGIPKSTLWRNLQKRVAAAEALVTVEVKEEVIIP